MVVGTVNKCIKITLCIFNLVFVVVGIVLIALGINAQNGFGKYLHLMETDDFSTPPKLFIAIGVIMFLIAFLGCCGAFMENHAMVMAYSVLVGLILVLQLGVGLAAYLMGDQLESLAEKGLTKTMNEYNNDTATDIMDIRRSWDLAQSELHCCGVSTYMDWNNVNVTHGPTHPLIPESCCLNGKVAACTKGITETNLNNTVLMESLIYTRGCLHAVIEDIAITKIGVIGIVLTVVELLGIICACFLARSIRYSYETV
jgi:CD63 antigen